MKAIVYKAEIEIADMDRNIYTDHSFTMAKHPSETDERMMVRLLAFALNAPEDTDHGHLEFARDMWEPDEPALWQQDYTGLMKHWIEVGQPDERRLLRVTARSERVTVYSYASSTPIWWAGLANRVSRAKNLTVWQIPEEQAEKLAALAHRTMRLHVSVQDGAIWVTEGDRSVEISPIRL